MITIDMYRTFVVLAGCLSVTEAGESLGISKSIVSKHIQTLQKHLGVELVKTTTRSVALTIQGKELLPYAQKLVDAFDEIPLRLQGEVQSPKGLLRVCIVSDFGVRRFSQVVGDFLEAYPEVQISVDITNDRRRLQSDKNDVRVFVGDLQGFESSVHKVTSITMFVVASPDYIERRGLPKSVRDLHHHNLLCYSGQVRGNEWLVLDREGNDYKVRVSGNVVANNIDIVLNTCRQGLGIAYVPSFICREALDAGELVDVFPTFKKITTDITIGYKQGMPNSILIEAFVNFMMETFSSDG